MPRFPCPTHLVTLLLLFGSFAPASAEEPKKIVGLQGIDVANDDWPWWRGKARDGIATTEQLPPLNWNANENVLWRIPVPGRGHGSASVVGDNVFLAAADEDSEKQMVLCIDRASGKLNWQTVVHEGGIIPRNKKASAASGTVACDGQRLFVTFVSNGAAHATSLDLKGKILWQTKLTDYVFHQGYGSSPALYNSLVIVSADNKSGGVVAALDRTSGKIIWSNDRPKMPNYPSPAIFNIDGKDQLLLTGCELVSSWDPSTGEKLWEIEGATTECVTTTVTDGTHMFTSGGYPTNHISCVRADGSGDVVWSNKTRVYVPSMLVRDGFLYTIADAGKAYCWNCETGEEMWEGRLGGTFSSSPVMVGDFIIAINERGEAFTFKANPKEFELVAENQMGDEVFSTPTVCGGRIYLRVAMEEDDKRQEWLYCLGNK